MDGGARSVGTGFIGGDFLVSEEPEFEAAEGGGEVGDEFIGLAEVINPEIGDEGESVFLKEGGRVVWVGWWTAEGSGGEVARGV